jgi:hypothetical protein
VALLGFASIVALGAFSGKVDTGFPQKMRPTQNAPMPPARRRRWMRQIGPVEMVRERQG